jgi:hypothetical protein
MSRRRRQRRQARIQAQAKRPQRKRLVELLRSVTQGVSTGYVISVGFVTLVTSVLGLYVLVPRVSFSDEGSLDAYQALVRSAFLVTNGGAFALSDLALSCQIRLLLTEKPTRIQYLTTRVPNQARLEPDQHTTIVCFGIKENPPSRLVHADITLLVSFRPALWPFRHERRQRFVGHVQGNEFLWRPMATR